MLKLPTPRRHACLTALLLALGACASGPSTPGRATPSGAWSARGRAQPGDTVYLVEHYVRADRRQQFEEFVTRVLWPAFQRTAANNRARARVLQQTRLLRPITANDDGTYTYTFVLDPVVSGESYSVLDLLREVYSDEEARQHYVRFTETWARDFTARSFVQGG